MSQDDGMKYRKAMLEARMGRTPRFVLLSAVISCLGWYLAYLSGSLVIGIVIQIIALIIPIERHISMRRYAKYLERIESEVKTAVREAVHEWRTEQGKGGQMKTAIKEAIREWKDEQDKS